MLKRRVFPLERMFPEYETESSGQLFGMPKQIQSKISEFPRLPDLAASVQDGSSEPTFCPHVEKFVF